MNTCTGCNKPILYGQPIATLHNNVFHLSCLVKWCEQKFGGNDANHDKQDRPAA